MNGHGDDDALEKGSDSSVKVLLVENHEVFAETVAQVFLSGHEVTAAMVQVGADAVCAKTDFARITDVIERVVASEEVR